MVFTKIIIEVNLRFIFLTFSFFIYISQVFATEPYTGIICTNKEKTTKLEFFFKEKDQGLIKVYKRVEGQFVEVGQVVGHKSGSFTLWEDKNLYKGIDFAWHLDKVTGVMKPFILSESTRRIKINPEPLSCRAESFWY